MAGGRHTGGGKDGGGRTAARDTSSGGGGVEGWGWGGAHPGWGHSSRGWVWVETQLKGDTSSGGEGIARMGACPGKRFHIYLTTSQTALQERLDPRVYRWVGPHFGQVFLVMATSCLLFKPGS